MRFLVVLVLVLGGLSACSTPPRDTTESTLSRVDHLVYATPDLERTVERFEDELGVRATPAGNSPERGTHGALIALGPSSYLEIVAPDPEIQNPSDPPWWVRGLTDPRLVQWAVKGTDLENVRTAAVRNGVPLGEVISGSRRRPDGVLLTWHMTSPRQPVAEGIVPFLIDWGASPHPATSSAQGARLVALRAEHPDHRRVESMLRQLGVELAVTEAPRPALVAILEGPRGRLELR